MSDARYALLKKSKTSVPTDIPICKSTKSNLEKITFA